MKKYFFALLFFSGCSASQQATAPCPVCPQPTVCPACPLPITKIEIDTVYAGAVHDTIVQQAALPGMTVHDTMVVQIPAQVSPSVYELPLPTGNAIEDQANLQANLDTAVSRGYRRIHFPVSGYQVTTGVILRNPTGGFVQGVEVFADGGDYGTPTIYCTTGAGFGLEVLLGKGCIIRGLIAQGVNMAPTSYPITQVCSNDTSSFVSPGVSASRWAPHAGFVVDGLNYGRTAAQSSPSGSTDIQFIDCRASNFVVDYCLQPGGAAQNGEAIRLINCWGDNCRSAISIGHSQERSVSVEHFRCWGQTKTVIDCSNFGDGTSCPPDVTDLNVAGCVRYLCELGTFISKGLTVRDSHLESVYGLGGCLTGQSNYLTLDNDWIAFQGNSAGCVPPGYVFQGAGLRVSGGDLFQYGAPNLQILAFKATQQDFKDVFFDWIPAQVTGCAPIYTNCSASGYPFGTDMVVSQGHIPAELTSSWFLWMGKSSIVYGIVAGEGWRTVRTRINDDTQYGYLIPQLVLGDLTAGSDTVKNVVVEGGTAVFAIPPALTMPELPPGTTVTDIQINGDTSILILSNPALVTEINAAILGGNWLGTSVGVLPNPGDPYKWGWKAGDIIINNRRDLYPTINSWLCVQSGVTGTAKMPQFRALTDAKIVGE